MPLLTYPLVAAADGARFPSRDDCVRLAAEGETGALDLVFGRRDTYAEADELLEQVRGVGYVDAVVRGDGCMRWKVLYDGIESYEQGASSPPRRAAPGSRRGSSSSRPADARVEPGRPARTMTRP